MQWRVNIWLSVLSFWLISKLSDHLTAHVSDFVVAMLLCSQISTLTLVSAIWSWTIAIIARTIKISCNKLELYTINCHVLVVAVVIVYTEYTDSLWDSYLNFCGKWWVILCRLQNNCVVQKRRLKFSQPFNYNYQLANQPGGPHSSDPNYKENYRLIKSAACQWIKSNKVQPWLWLNIWIRDRSSLIMRLNAKDKRWKMTLHALWQWEMGIYS